MGDRDGGGAQFLHAFDDKLVDDVGHDGIEAGGRLVEEDDLRFGGDGAGQRHALLHAAGQFCRRKFGDIGAKADLGELLHRLVAGRFAVHAPALDQAEGDVFPDRQRIEEGAALKQHAELLQDPLAVARAHADDLFAIDQDAAALGLHQAEDAFERHRFAGARSADDDEGFARAMSTVTPSSTVFGPKLLWTSISWIFGGAVIC